MDNTRPACAVCMVEFVPGEKFLIRGSFVVHRTPRCVSGMPQVHRDLAQSEHDLDVSRRALERERTDHQHTRWTAQRESADQQSRISDLTVRSLAKDREHQAAADQLRQTRADLANERQDHQNTRLRHALAVQQLEALGANPDASSSASPDPVDDTAARFAMLELD